MRTGALERVVERAADLPPVTDRCALCAAALTDDHPHLVTVGSGQPCCACTACSLLFERTATAPYRRVPERRARVDGLRPAALGVPVGLAFFVVGQDGRVAAHYPSPAGATRWEVDEALWRAAAGECAALVSLEPAVEALLVDTTGGRSEAWIVPVTDCYRLVAAVRQQWSGLSGGERVWKSIRAFFDQLRTT